MNSAGKQSPQVSASRPRAWHAVHLVILALVVLFGRVVLSAQDSATIVFSLDFPNSDPEHYSISVQSDGHAKYESSGNISKDSDDKQTYQSEFKFSEATRARIFELAAQAHYFEGKVDSGNKKLAFTGGKKLSYKDSQRSTQAEYNYSQHPVIQQLTTLFQNVSATQEFGRRLSYFHRYQKLALDDELKRMESQARGGELMELGSVKPILQEVYDDTAVIKVVRGRAMRIMEMGNSVPAPR